MKSSLALMFSLLTFAGCSARTNQFNTFAQAGTTYITASQAVIQAAGTATVNTDSAFLMKIRPNLDQAGRQKAVTDSDTLLKQRLQVLQLISAHSNLLQSYFSALASLSDPKATDTVGTAAQGIYQSLSKISPSLKNAKIGTTTVSSFIPTVTAPLVAVFKAQALDKELKAHSADIANELALQEAAFSAIEAELKTDTQEQQNLKETDSINQFAANANLPADWVSQRQAILSPAPAIAASDAASKAASQLRTTFNALVENRLDSSGFASLMTNISNMLTISQTIEAAVK